MDFCIGTEVEGPRETRFHDDTFLTAQSVRFPFSRRRDQGLLRAGRATVQSDRSRGRAVPILLCSGAKLHAPSVKQAKNVSRGESPDGKREVVCNCRDAFQVQCFSVVRCLRPFSLWIRPQLLSRRETFDSALDVKGSWVPGIRLKNYTFL